jgi:flagellar biosynthesis protein FlhF
MQIKRFEARTMTEALKLVKDELGPEAVILSACSRRSAGGVLGCFKKAGVEVTAAGGGPLQPLHPLTYAKDCRGGELEDLGYPAAGRRSPRPNRFPASAPSQTRMPVKRSEAEDGNRAVDRTAEHWLYRRLVSRGVEEKVARQLTTDFLRHANGHADDPAVHRSRIAGIIAQMGASVKPLAIERGQQRRVALVGPSGVGKTTAAAKLAALYALDPDLEVALLSLDNYRVAASDQLRAYADIIGVPAAVVVDQVQLDEALEKFRRHDLVLIDTPGINPRDAAPIRMLTGMLEKVEGLEVHLLLSAAARMCDCVDLFDQLTGLPVERLMFSKIDETNACGSLLNIVLRLRLPVACLFDGATGPDGIKDADLETLAALLTDTNGAGSGAATAPLHAAAPGDREQPPQSAEAYAYVANRNSNVFHTADCKWAATIKDENMIGFKNMTEARDHQYKPCRTCCREALVDRRAESAFAGRSQSVGWR